MYYYPNFLGGKRSKMEKYFRKNQSYAIGNPNRHPIKNCVFKFPVDISFGSTKPSEQHILRLNDPFGLKISGSKTQTKNAIKDYCPIVEKYNYATRYILTNTTRYDLLEEEIGFPFVAKLIYGSGGKGMYFIKSLDDLNIFIEAIPKHDIRKYFFESLYDFNIEYRIHVSPLLVGLAVTYKFEYGVKNENGLYELRAGRISTRNNGEIFSVEKRVPPGHVGTRNFNEGIMFNSNFIRPACWEEMVTASLKAAELLKLDFCCTDILYNSTTNKFVISETNTNPGMDNVAGNPAKNITAQHYQQAFPLMITQKYIKSCVVSSQP